MDYRKLIAIVLICTFTFALPISIKAQSGWDVPVFDAADTLAPVPISDAAARNKEVGLTIFGITIPGLSMDSIVIGGAKILIKEIVDDTIDWINNGFEGNPAYVTDLKKYFTNIADNIAGEFIAGTDLGFLCSPFQAKIRLALQRYVTQRRQFQCTLTGVVANIDAFYNNFDEGGWDAWFVMTQNDVNNPYGAYLEAQTELDERIASALGIENKKLTTNDLFKDWSPCAKEDPDTGECFEREPVKTPGKIIESQLVNTLGTEIRQLELADEFDELVNALFYQLLKKTVNSAKGLFN